MPTPLLIWVRRDILLNQLNACEKLIAYAKDNNELGLIQTEINELKLMLDLVVYLN